MTNKNTILNKLENDLISSKEITSLLKKEFNNIPLYTFKTLASTNEKAKELASNKAPHGTVIISEEQTAGKGRMGRSFYSPANSGIYMSIILKPNLKIYDSVLITTAASVAVCTAIENTTSITPKIKWINDIMVNNKKVCGILTEAVTDFKTDNIQYVVIGIGINFTTPLEHFPKEIKNIAVSLFNNGNNNISRNTLCAEIINEILYMIKDIKNYNFIDEYKEKSIVLNKEINFIKGNIYTKGKVIDINNDGSLVVKKDTNEIVILNSGEISIRSFIDN